MLFKANFVEGMGIFFAVLVLKLPTLMDRHWFKSYFLLVNLYLKPGVDTQLLLRNSYYQTFYGPILRFLVTFYSVYEVKCDQKVEYGTIKSSIVRISPLYSI